MRLIRTIVSLSLALLVLVSSTSFTVGLHVCRGHVRDIAVMHEAKPCAMKLMAAELGFAEEDCGLSAMKCCEDRTLAFEGTDYQYKAPAQITLQGTTAAPAVLPFLLSVVSSAQSTAYPSVNSYKPPLIQRDVTVLIQSFLI